MVNRKLFVFLIVVMFIVGIGCVSAQNIDENGTSSSDIANNVVCLDDSGEVDTIDSVEDDVSISSVDEEVISDRGSTQEVNSWVDLKSKIENRSVDTVKLNASNIAPSTSSSDQISINHDITIVGGEGYYIGSASWNSAPKYNYIPMITSGNNLNVKFENVTFQYLSNNIFIKLMGNGNYTFKNCVFNHINATGDHQSVIWLNYGHALIENCNFTNCTCSFGAVTNYYSSLPNTANYARMTVKNSIFKDNYATTEPGAINNCGQLVVYDSTFENNEAFWWAGAIHTHSYANTTIVHSTFKDNKAGWNGGALYTYSYLTVLDSTFISNIAEGVVSGGAIAGSNYGSNPQVLINNSTFMYNVANQKGGAISIWDAGYLKVYNSLFINNTENNHLNAISYSYSGNSYTAAYLIYISNTFVGPNNASGSVTYGNSYLNVTNCSNIFIDSGNYNGPENNNATNTTNNTNETNEPIGNITELPSDAPSGDVVWAANLGGALSGTPVIVDEYILIPASHTLYCYTLDGDYVWNVTNEWAYFHELLVDDDVVFAPCSGDKLYILDLDTGISLTNNNIYQGSSLYAPVMDAYGNIYIASEYGYGSNSNLWITVVKYENGDYVYSHSILEIGNIPYGSPALLSQPVITESGYFLINTVNGLMYANLINGQIGANIIEGSVGNIAVDVNNHIYYILMDANGYAGVLLTNSYFTGPNGFYLDEIGDKLVIDTSDYNSLYTVTNEGYIYFIKDIIGETSLGCLYGGDHFHVNHVSSTMAAYDDLLYIGDDAGLLWVIDTTCESTATIDEYLIWAFDAHSSIVGGILVDEDYVYIGTENGTFYALTY